MKQTSESFRNTLLTKINLDGAAENNQAHRMVFLRRDELRRQHASVFCRA